MSGKHRERDERYKRTRERNTERSDRGHERSDRNQNRLERHLDRERNQERGDRHQERCDRYQERGDRNQERSDRYQDRDRHQDRFERNQERGERNHERDDRNNRPTRKEDREERASRKRKSSEPTWGKVEEAKAKPVKPVDKEKPNFELSGKLTEDVNTVNGVVIKYCEPADSRKPKRRWRLYPFKGEKALPTLFVHRQSAYLMGRDRKIADIPLDHPSCSKQHAVLQYRSVLFRKENGTEGRRVRPYLIDLESANGTFVNNVKLEPRRYHELLERDVMKFGFSTREYVLLHEHSKDDEYDDDLPSDDKKPPEEK